MTDSDSASLNTDSQLSTSSRKRKAHSIKTKLEVVEYAKKFSQSAASTKFNVGRTSVRKWVEQEGELREAGPSASRRLPGAGRRLTFSELDEQLANWVKEHRAQKMKISRRIIQQQAEKLFVRDVDNGENDFKNGVMGKKKNKTTKLTSNDDVAKQVRFNSSSVQNNGHAINSKTSMLHRSPSAQTLSRLDRETYVIWRRPFWTLIYCILEVFCLVRDFLKSLLHWRRLIPCIFVATAVSYFLLVPGPLRDYAERFQKPILWAIYWVWLGVLSSIGLGTGLHTFVLYLGPHIAHVTLAAFECNSVDFPEPPYPTDVTCPTYAVPSVPSITLWDIIGKVRLESIMWGVGTALGELPPYFMAKAARLSGQEIDDEEFREYQEYLNGQSNADDMGFFNRWKVKVEKFMEMVIKRVGFPGILFFASIPNPLFDLAGFTCGHFLTPFWTFFGATLIGKAVVKMHLQMLCVVIAFSEHHMEDVISRLMNIPYVGEYIQLLLKEFLQAQKMKLHRRPTDPIPEQATSTLQMVMNTVVTGMVGIFLITLINSSAQRYHKRLSSANKSASKQKLK